MLSLCSVFKDIIPGYRIRELESKERNTAVSKEVKQVREYEQALLKNYQMFLQRLHAVIVRQQNSKGTDKKLNGMMNIAVKCMCILLVEVPHFNYRSNIVQVVVPRMNKKKNPEIADMCCESVVKLFKSDDRFEASQEIVKAMARVIKASNYRTRTEMIKCFLSLQLNDRIIRAYLKEQAGEEAGSAKNPNPKKKHRSKMLKKKDKASKLLDKDLKETKADVDKKAFARRQTETLSHVFVTYFRILKNGQQSPLLPTVLQGLSRHAHLIDANFFGDLITVLKQIMVNPQTKNVVVLECVRTACTLLSSQEGMATNVDIKAFHDTLYRVLAEIKTDEDVVPPALMCARLLLHERREVSLDRVAAFAKRLSICALRLEPHQAVAALFNVRSLVNKYPKLTAMLDNDMLTTSMYRPELLEPEHSCPFALPMWELCTLAEHYFPWVATHAKHVAYGAPSAGHGSLPAKQARAKPHQIYNAFDARQHYFSFNPQMKPVSLLVIFCKAFRSCAGMSFSEAIMPPLSLPSLSLPSLSHTR